MNATTAQPVILEFPGPTSTTGAGKTTRRPDAIWTYCPNHCDRTDHKYTRTDERGHVYRCACGHEVVKVEKK